MIWPIFTVVPLAMDALIVPEAGALISSVILSVSNSAMMSSIFTLALSGTVHRERTPSVTDSPTLGMIMFVAMGGEKGFGVLGF